MLFRVKKKEINHNLLFCSGGIYPTSFRRLKPAATLEKISRMSSPYNWGETELSSGQAPELPGIKEVIKMPRGDGTGPMGKGPGTGRGQGRGMGGRMGGRAAGPGGFCVCPSCGEKISHQAGIPCFDRSCPKCGTKMVRG